MTDFLLSEQFRLELHWEDTIYENEGVCKLINAYFSGPVIQIAQKINDNDHIMLDFYSQYMLLVKGTYVAKFSWASVKYHADGKKIFLKNSIIEHTSELNNVPRLKSEDYFVIDTSDHESTVHQYNFVYKTYLVNNDNILYRFD